MATGVLPIVLALVSFVGVWVIKGNLDVAASLLWISAFKTVNEFLFGVIPLYVLMGLLTSAAGMGKASRCTMDLREILSESKAASSARRHSSVLASMVSGILELTVEEMWLSGQWSDTAIVRDGEMTMSGRSSRALRHSGCPLPFAKARRRCPVRTDIEANCFARAA